MPTATVALGLSTAFALFAFVVATVALWRSRQALRWVQWPHARMERLELESGDNCTRIGQLHGQIKRINARLAARERRARDDDDDTSAPGMADRSTGFARQPGETDLEWKRRMRAAIATGAVKHGG